MKRHLFLPLIAITLLFASCGNNNDVTIQKCKRTILVYMVSNNSLGDWNNDTKDIEEMKTAISADGTQGCRFVIYKAGINGKPELFEIYRTDKGTAQERILKSYSPAVKSTTASRLCEVFNDVKVLSPANEYALILWSHASGWAEDLENKGARAPFRKATPQSFGDDRGTECPIDVLASSIPGDMFDFIYCDCCYMSCIEVAYQLRDKTKYFVASPTLLPADGMPYDQNLKEFFKDIPDLKAACLNTYNHYAKLTGREQTITIALYDMHKINDVANACRDIITCNPSPAGTEGIQKYETPSEYNCLFYDFKQYFTTQANGDRHLADRLVKALDELIICKYATPYIFNLLYIDPQHFSGVSTYIPGTGNSQNENYYKTLDWYKQIYNN